MINRVKGLLRSGSIYEENELLKESLENANKANEEYKETVNELIERVSDDDAEILKLKDKISELEEINKKYKELLNKEVNAYNDLLKEINGISRQFVSKVFHASPSDTIVVKHKIGKEEDADKLAWNPKESVTVPILTQDTVNKNNKIYGSETTQEKPKVDPNFFHITDDTISTHEALSDAIAANIDEAYKRSLARAFECNVDTSEIDNALHHIDMALLNKVDSSNTEEEKTL